MKRIIIASTSTLYEGSYLEYLLPTLKTHFKGINKILFIPYARPGGISHDDYTKKVNEAFAKIDIAVKGIHEFENPVEALQQAKGIFTGGGNTFLLVTQLYKIGIIETLEKVVKNGTPYLGTSAGSNICGLTMGTTNDMPIVYPPSFNTLAFVPFNINPHYLDPIEGSTHMGETRETRINEFHYFNSQPVLGLREGSWLEVNDSKITLKGALPARLFKQNQEAVELETGADLSNLK
ncbi:dipeptidase E [Flavobacterium enshiense DK69]|uniref:(Alpha)-aspartyl dipeptidase n=1 Tax=Flavobacterium enshiense DK69 TaxID=1107311 RepID=V6SAL6_9FLAO|nr:dipeptidase PepE [Flavobacterium enshiense]ESU23282.1 dipeptidase E [Flavobacterium enshiense DK69]KGO96488.1 (alpha)-aspartyl dipeptidase [Flavobacterium enshiense DK69]